MKKIAIGMGLFAASFAVTMIFNQSANASVEKQLETNLVSINAKLAKEIENRTELAKSSNPYDYIKDSAEFENIVNLGEEVLPVLEKDR